MTDLAAGIDIGTSGVRAIAVDRDGEVHGQHAIRLPPSTVDGSRVTQAPERWWEGVQEAMRGLTAAVGAGRIAALAVDGTSGTLLLSDGDGRPLGPVRMYDDSSGSTAAPRVRELAPPESGAHGAASPAAWLIANAEPARDAAHVLHQADWIVGRLTGRIGVSDDNNALKTGWDPVAREWPAWLDAAGIDRRGLPEVFEPGSPVGEVTQEVTRALGLAAGCRVLAGTTDGCASFLATGAALPGDGVTALGTTLTIKLIADRPIFDAASGVYSHRLLGGWLAGGASNSGGAALARFFTPDRIRALETTLDPDRPTGLDFYPLPGTGERFPIADPAMPSRHGPRPADDATFLQALLEGVAAVEALAYRRLRELGAPALRSVRTVGGGAGNVAWGRIRSRQLGVEMPGPTHGEAAYGTALLARRGLPA